MIRAILYKDICLLKKRGRFWMWLPVLIAGTLFLIKVSGDSTSVRLFGREFMNLFLISLVSLGTFLELYMSCLFDDYKDDVVPMLAFNNMSFVAYWIARAIVPIAFAALTGALTLCAYVLFIDPTSLVTGFLLSAGIAMLAEVCLSMGLGMIASLFFDIDITTNPSIALPLMGVNALLLYLFNPAHGILPFVASTSAVGIACLVASAFVSKARYKSNIQIPPDR